MRTLWNSFYYLFLCIPFIMSVYYNTLITITIFITTLLVLLALDLRRKKQLLKETGQPLTQYLLTRYTQYHHPILKDNHSFAKTMKTIKIRRILGERTSLKAKELIPKYLLEDLL